MTERMLKVLPLGVFGSLVLTLVAVNTAPSQEPIPLVAPGQPPVPQLLGPRPDPTPVIPVGGRQPTEAQPEPVPLPLPVPGQPAQPAQGDDIEVLAKGPVHEAFAATAEAPTAAPVVAKQPPEPIEELPPDQKPEGDNVQWIPGYWSWDEEAARFIWVSGFWRQPPPGRVWVAGSWREVKGGWQYVAGFWQEVPPQQPQQPEQPQVQPEIEYLPPPPVSLEIGPTVAAPSSTSVYVPGSWVWRNKYVWRPGVWIEHRRDWVWVSARYHWTPAGYVFCDGYWDYPLATRGVLFAPIVFTRPVYVRPAFVYTPVYVVSEPCMTGALFVRRGHGNYYFGDYFDNRYVDRGYSAWCGTVGRNGFSIGFGVGRTWGYDPLWSYYSVQYRNSPRWNGGVNDLYVGRYRGDVARPPVTLVQQNTVINRISNTNVNNVTNNITVVNGAPTVNNRDVSNVAMVAPLKVAPDLQRTRFEGVTAERRRDEAVAAKQIRDVGTQRTKLETAVVNRPQPVATPGAVQPAVQPQTIKLDVPKVAAQRAAVRTDDKAPPPNPLRTANTTPGAKVDPPKIDPKLPVTPKVNPPVNPLPKVEPKTPVTPPVNPLPKVDPKLPVNPKVEPNPPVAPKVEPPKVNPPVTPLPKVEPKTPVVPPVAPKVEPPKVNPPVNPLPKVDPPKADPKPPVAPPVAPKVNPPAPPVVPPAAPKVNPPAPVAPPVAPKVNPPAPPPPAPVVQPKLPPPPPAPVVPKVNPPAPPPPPAPVVPPRPPAPAPKADPKPAPKPLAVAPPVVQPPLKPVAVAPVQPGPQPAPVAQPRPAAVVPAAPPMKVVQPPAPKPPAAQPQPAPIGKPGKKPR